MLSPNDAVEHFEPTEESIDFWRRRLSNSPCQCDSCRQDQAEGEFCFRSLEQATQKIIVAHLELVSCSSRQSQDELLETKLGKEVKSWFEGSRSEPDNEPRTSIKSTLESSLERLQNSCIGEPIEVRKRLILFSGLFSINEALVSLREPTDNWPKKCTIAQDVVSWHLSVGRRGHIDKWMQMWLRKAAGMLFFSVAKLKEACSHQNFLLAFKWFERMIERCDNTAPNNGSRKLIIRKPDKNIVANEFTITGLVSMAACLLELRQTARVQNLLSILLEKLFPQEIASNVGRYLKAYASYLQGVCLFEDTNPQRLAIRKPTDEKSENYLNEKYTKAEKYLNESAKELEFCAPKSLLLASVYTVRGIVRVNMFASFNSAALDDLSKATDLECAVGQPSATNHQLLQILKLGAESDSPKEDLDKWHEVYKKASENHEKVSLKVDSKAFSAANRKNANVEGDSEATNGSTGASEVQGREPSDSIISQLEEPLSSVNLYLDCYRKKCLEYFKDRLNRCKETKSYMAEILCHLFISKYYLYAGAKAKVECHQAKVSRLLQMYFGIHLSAERYSSISLKSLQSDEKYAQKGPALALICSFWMANEAEVSLMTVVAKNLSLFSPRLHTSDNKSSKLIRTAAFLKIFFSSNHFRLIDPAFRKCKALNDHAALLCRELSADPSLSQSVFVTFLKIYVGELSYRMCHKIKDNQDFLASKRRKTFDQLSSILKRDLSTADSNVEPSSLAVMCLTALGDYSDADRKGPASFGIPELQLRRYQLAYDLCSAAGLADTEVQASLHLSVGSFLYSNACADLHRPAFESFNAAIYKFRQAAQIFDTICGDHVGTAMAQGMIAVLYFNQRQLEDQENLALESFSNSLRLEVSLLRNDRMSSPWLWKTIEVARKCRYLFNRSHSVKMHIWDLLTKRLEMIRDGDFPSLFNSDKEEENWSKNALLFWEISDPLFDADEVFLAETSRHLRDMIYPRNSLPTETEIRCYARYLQSMWNYHKRECAPKGAEKDSKIVHYLKKPFVPLMAQLSGLRADSAYSCPLYKFWIHPRTHDFLAGLNNYTVQLAKSREATFLTLQENHRRMMSCAKIQAFLAEQIDY